MKSARITKPKAPWLTYPLKLILQEKDRAPCKYQSCKTEENWSNYQEKRNFALASIRRKKAAYLTYLDNQKRTKELWNGLRCMNVSYTQKSDIPSSLVDPFSVNNYFASVFNDNNDTLNFYENNNKCPSCSFSFSLVEW